MIVSTQKKKKEKRKKRKKNNKICIIPTWSINISLFICIIIGVLNFGQLTHFM